MLFTNVYMEPNILVQKALDAAKDWDLAQLMDMSASKPISNPTPLWSPPFKDEFKSNIDFS